jgi:hypothetical protein
LKSLFRKALTRTIYVKQGQEEDSKLELVEVPPSQQIMYAIFFSVAALAALAALEVAHMAFLGSWNTEVFAGIMSVVTFVLGVFIGQKA